MQSILLILHRLSGLRVAVCQTSVTSCPVFQLPWMEPDQQITGLEQNWARSTTRGSSQADFGSSWLGQDFTRGHVPAAQVSSISHSHSVQIPLLMYLLAGQDWCRDTAVYPPWSTAPHLVEWTTTSGRRFATSRNACCRCLLLR